MSRKVRRKQKRDLMLKDIGIYLGYEDPYYYRLSYRQLKRMHKLHKKHYYGKLRLWRK